MGGDGTGPAALDAEPEREVVERAAPGEPFFVDVGFYAVTLRHIDFERGDETFAAWIRDSLQDVVAPDADGDYVGRQADYTPTHDTPDANIIERVTPAEPGDCIKVRVEFPAAVLVAAWESGIADPLAEGIRRTVSVRLAKIGRREEYRPPVTIEVPPETVTRARLKAEHTLVRNPDEDYHDALQDALLDIVERQTEYAVEGGGVIASFADGKRGEMASDEAEATQRAADQIHEALVVLDEVDLNPLLADDVRTLLDSYDDLQNICLRLRDHQHTLEDHNREDR
jgi:hypothetical protein